MVFKFKFHCNNSNIINIMENEKIRCFICGNYFCHEDVDHAKMSFEEFDDLLRTKAGFCPDIANLKFKIRRAFHKIQKKAPLKLQSYITELILFVDKLHFWYLLQFQKSLKDIEAAIFGYMIPRNQVIRLVHLLKKESNPSIVFPYFNKLLDEVAKFKKNSKWIIEKSDYGSLIYEFTKIVRQGEKEFEFRNCVKYQRRTFSCGENVSQKQENMGEFVVVAGIPFSTQRKSIDLSILEMDDRTLMANLSSLQKMRNVKEIQIRNSTLSKRGYRMFFNCFPNLQSIDISSCISCNFLEVLCEKQQDLKTLYINRAQLNNEGLKKLEQKLPQLRVLYADSNNISSEAVMELFQSNTKIVYASFKNNGIENSIGLKIQANLALKGGYFQY